jgi:Acyl dehydratase
MHTVSFHELPALSGQTLRSSSTKYIDQALVIRFTELSGDRQWIHCDPSLAVTKLPHGRTIIPGGLLLALLPHLLQQTFSVRQVDRSYTTAYRQIRFHETLPTGSTIGLIVHFRSARPGRSFTRVETACRIVEQESSTIIMSAEMTNVYYPAIL